MKNSESLNNKNNKTEDVFVLICLFLYTSAQVFYYSNVRISLPVFYQITVIIRLFSVLILSILILNRIGTLKNLFKFMGVIILSTGVFLLTANHEFYFLLLFMLLYSLKGVKLTSILSSMNAAIISSTTIIVILSLLTIIDDNVLMRRTENSEFIRSSLGFSHPNVFGFMLLEIAINFMLIEKLKKDKFVTVKTSTISLICIFIISYFSDSRTSLLIVIGMLFYLFIIDRGLLTNKLIYIIGNFSIIFSLIFTYYFSVNFSYANPTHITLNRVFSNRLMFLYQFYSRYGSKFFGQEVQMSTSRIGSNYFFLDSGIGRIYVEFGILFGILFMFLLFYSNFLGFKNDLIVVNVYITYIIVYSIIQDRMVVEPGWTIPALYVLIEHSNLFLENKNIKKNKKLIQ